MVQLLQLITLVAVEEEVDMVVHQVLHLLMAQAAEVVEVMV